jgi:hypothetical protein
MEDSSTATQTNQPPVPITVDPRVARLYSSCNGVRRAIKLLAGDVDEMRRRETYGIGNGEVPANITLAYRHLEDASMRLGKALQALDGGVSVYDKSTTVGAPEPTPDPIAENNRNIAKVVHHHLNIDAPEALDSFLASLQFEGVRAINPNAGLLHELLSLLEAHGMPGEGAVETLSRVFTERDNAIGGRDGQPASEDSELLRQLLDLLQAHEPEIGVNPVITLRRMIATVEGRGPQADKPSGLTSSSSSSSAQSEAVDPVGRGPSS